MRTARGIGWAGLLTTVGFIGACNPAVAPPAAPKAAPATTPVVAVPRPTPPTTLSLPPADPAPPPRPAATSPEPPTPQPAPMPVVVAPAPPPAAPLAEPDRVKQMAALEQQMVELQAKYDALRTAGPRVGTPAAPPEPKKPEYPSQIGGKSLDEWLKETHSPDPVIRESACRAVPGFGPDARKPAIRDMVRLVTDEDSGVRMAALGTVGAMMFDDKQDQTQVFAALRLLLSNTFNGAPGRLYATRALAAYGTDAGLPANIAVLDQIKNDPWWETRKAVANALGLIGAPVYDDPPKKDPATGNLIPKRPASELAQKALRHILETDKSAAVRLEGVYGLIAHGPPPYLNTADYLKAIRPNLDAVTARLTGKSADGKKTGKEDDNTVRVWLYVLQMTYDDRSVKETLPKVAEYLQDPSLVVRAQALNAIASLGTQAEPVLPQVRECLVLYKDQPVLVAAVIRVLTAMGKNSASGLIPDLEQVARETKDEELKKLAAEAIRVLSGMKKAADPKAAAKP